MKTITNTNALHDFCQQAASCEFVTVDTEFLRERTYFAQLCLVQLAMPGDTADTGVLVDVLSQDLDLGPMYDLFRNTDVVKVFHAARQDLEIFYVDGNVIPTPLFDTQIAAMVCGFGEQVGYETLVRKICNTGLDKSSRFTDWSRRPLSEKQMVYALADVTHLRDIYLHLSEELAQTGREAWVKEELAQLMAAENYVVHPDDAWKRVKTRSNSPRFLAVVRELAKLREQLAQDRNVPRNRVFKDDVILELAATRPTTLDELGKLRLLQREARRGELADNIIKAVSKALELPKEELPSPPEQRVKRPGNEGLSDLLRVLLKARADETKVAQKLIATSSDLEEFIADDSATSPLLKGWRHEVFGRDAQRLCAGEIALSADGDSVRIVDLDQ